MKFNVYLYALVFILSTTPYMQSYERPMVVIIPSYKNEQWVEKNLSSVYEQQYSNMRVIYIDDCSPDLTYQKAVEITAAYNKQSIATIIRNDQRCGALANLYNAIVGCQDHEIIVTLDGDDWLSDPDVLSRLNKYYDQDIWITYGQFQECPGGKGVGHSVPFPDQVIKTNAFRSYHTDRALLPASHLRTFYAWLFKSIKKEDLMQDGQFYSMSWDIAFMVPMLEMSGYRHLCINDVMYIYNRLNPISDCYKNARLQLETAYQILRKEPYKTLKKPLYWDKNRPSELPITIIIVAHNNEDSYERCLESVFKQEYGNFRTIIIDDASTDGTAEYIKSYCTRYAGSVPVVLRAHNTLSSPVACFYRSVHECDNDEIILMMSCEDWLSSDQTLSNINTMFRDPNLWVVQGVLQEFPAKDGYLGSKICTACYAELLKKIRLEDLMYKNFFYPVDVATAFEEPIRQLAGVHLRNTGCLKVMRDTSSLFIGPKDQSINKAFNGIMRVRKGYEPLVCLRGKQVRSDDGARLVILSEDNPVQLDAFLTSITAMVKGITNIDVLYHSSATNKDSYATTISHWPTVSFTCSDSMLSSLLLMQHVDTLQTDFCVVTTDRATIEDSIDFRLCVYALKEHNLDVFYISLGASVTKLDMFLTHSLPCLDQEQKIYVFDCENKNGTWVLPMLDMTVWSKNRLGSMLSRLDVCSIEELKVHLQEQCVQDKVIGLMFDVVKVIM